VKRARLNPGLASTARHSSCMRPSALGETIQRFGRDSHPDAYFYQSYHSALWPTSKPMHSLDDHRSKASTLQSRMARSDGWLRGLGAIIEPLSKPPIDPPHAQPPPPPPTTTVQYCTTVIHHPSFCKSYCTYSTSRRASLQMGDSKPPRGISLQ
jgi:hypothetical protein